MKINQKNLFGIALRTLNKKNALEKIKKYIGVPTGFFHIVSLNPEIVVIAKKDRYFREIVSKGQIQIVDGVGVVLAGKMLHLELADRTQGAELMETLLNWAGRGRLRVMLIGGKGNLAESISDCYSSAYPEARFIGVEGIKDIRKPKKKEEEEIFSIITARRPHIVFVAFGSPYQELWLWKHKDRLKRIVCMGVGGGFDYVSGSIQRAPLLIQKIGLEWLYRLIRQPWRWRRQLRLIEFIGLVLKERLSKLTRFD